MAGPSERDPEAFIKSERVLAAHRLLLSELPKLGLTPSHNSGHVQAVRLHDVHNRYVFSWITNAHHLLFYVRQPALNSSYPLRGMAHRDLPHPTESNAGEVKARLEGEGDAKAVLGWLRAVLPLPAPPGSLT
jgi:hypothetical protein